MFIKPKEIDSGRWKPDADKEECGQDLNLSFIYCDDEESDCIAKRNEFTFMVFNEITLYQISLTSD